MSNQLEQFESTSNDTKYSVRFNEPTEFFREHPSAAAASSRMTAEGQLPKLSIEGLEDYQQNAAKPDMTDYATRRAANVEAANADRRLPGLMERAGKKDGLTDKDLEKLAADDKLTPEEKRAVKFMRDNYETLQTGGWRFDDKITPDSFKENAKDATKVDAKRTGDAARELEDVLRKKPTEVEVKAGWGWYRIAEESLHKQGSGKPNPQDIIRETERLQKLNPDKVRMVHPGDKIKLA
jgi:hypothetical protein